MLPSSSSNCSAAVSRTLVDACRGLLSIVSFVFPSTAEEDRSASNMVPPVFTSWDLAFCLPGCLDNYFLTRRGWFSLCHVTVWLSLFWIRLRGICDHQLARTDSRIPRLVISEIATLRLFAWVQLTRPDGFIFFLEGLSLYGELVPEDECWTAVLWKNMLPPVQILASEFEY